MIPRRIASRLRSRQFSSRLALAQTTLDYDLEHIGDDRQWSNTMTRNNLDEQLRWLRREKPSKVADMSFLPRATWSFATIADDSAFQGFDGSANDDFDDDLDDSAFAISNAALPRGGSPRPADRCLTTAHPPLQEYNQAAHLREVSAACVGQASEVEAARDRRIPMSMGAGVSSAHPVRAHTSSTVGDLHSTETGRCPTSSPSRDSDIEVMDMTSGFAQYSTPAPSRSRKRKSSEIASVTEVEPHNPQRVRIAEPAAKSLPTSRSHLNDSAMQSKRSAEAEERAAHVPRTPDLAHRQEKMPTGPPPPYSTHPPLFSTNIAQYRHEALTRNDYDDDEDLFDFNGTRASNVTVKRKSPARQPVQPSPIPQSPIALKPSIHKTTHKGLSTPVPSSSARAASKHDTTELDEFLVLAPASHDSLLHNIEQRQHDGSIAAATLLEQDDNAAAEALFDELDRLKAAHGAIVSLRHCSTKMTRLVQARDECHAALTRHIREHGGRDIANVKTANASAKDELESFQAECLVLLNTCRPYLNDVLRQSTVAATQAHEVRRDLAPVSSAHDSASRISATMLPPPSTANQKHVFSHDERSYKPGYGFSTVAGSSKVSASQHVPDIDYGLEDGDDADMLELAQPQSTRTPRKEVATPRRHALGEMSANARPTPKSAKSRTSLIVQDDPQFASLFQHPWSNDVKRMLRERFKLQGFRQGQLEAINATLAGEDTFVLMPTGGGKSLCYQLPSQIKTGKTRGVTIVVSPLLSLMEDQCQHLKQLNIQAFLINSASSKAERTAILEGLRSPNAETLINILYVTPEMLSKSTVIVSALENLHRNHRLARLVIDEAHCVSQWGHDFRPDYKLLGDFRRRFPAVPVMALTATATENVKADTIHNLSIDGCKVMTRSFNRPNLYYEVRSKGKAKEDQASIAELISSAHKNQTGIIYCLSRKNCEDMATALRTLKIKAQHYHAGMDAAEKNKIQKDWQEGRYHVIVATIAFGMGIDKGNVRFVVHNSMPKSLEGYYQETGRAGRDGEPSKCYLYFGLQDVGKLRRMIDDNEACSYEQKQRQHEMLRRMVQYCTNKTDCRRVQVLSYFSEAFNAKDCQYCDNCCSGASFEKRDVTTYANNAVDLVKSIQSARITMLYCIDVFRGASKKNIRDNNHDKLELFGAGRDLEREDTERLFASLIAQGALVETQVMNAGGFPVQYAEANASARHLNHVELSMRLSPKPRKRVAELPLSTNVSSPVVQARSKSKSVKRVVRDYESDGEEAFMEAPPMPARSSKAITTEDMLDNPECGWHQIAVEDFLIVAKDLVRKIISQNGLRITLFSDTVLRQMILSWTTDLATMKQIPNINKANVDKYGSRFIKLIRSTQKEYNERVGMNDDDAVNDPNAVVIEVSSDDESSEESTYGDLDEEDLDVLDDNVQTELAKLNSVFADSQSAAMRQQTAAPEKVKKKRYGSRAAKPYKKNFKGKARATKKTNTQHKPSSFISMMPT